MTQVRHLIVDEYAYLEVRWLAMNAPTELVMPFGRMDDVLSTGEAALKLSSQDPWRKRKKAKQYSAEEFAREYQQEPMPARAAPSSPRVWTRRPRSQLQRKHSYYQGNF